MSIDNRRYLFLSFSGIMRGFIDKNLSFGKIATGIFYLDCNRNTIFSPSRYGYEGPLHEEGRGYLVYCLREAEKESQSGIFKRLIYRNKTTDRQLRLLNILLDNADLDIIELDQARNFQQGISVLRRRCVFKDIIE